MKKLMIVCMVAAIGAVTLIDKSNAGPGDGCMGPTPGGQCGFVGQGHPNLNQPHPQFHGGQPDPNWQANGNNQWWLNHPHHRHGWNGGPPVIGFGIYTGPSYDDGPYYDDSYGYGPDPYAYSYRPRSYSSVGRCDVLAQRLRNLGYRNVRATDCAGASFVYRATKAGKPVKITMRASNGSIIRVASAY